MTGDDELKAFVDRLTTEVTPDSIHLGSNDKIITKSTANRNRRRRKEHWAVTVPLALIAAFFGVRFLTTAMSSEISPNSIAMLNLGITMFAGMMSFLVYVSYTQEEGDGKSESPPHQTHTTSHELRTKDSNDRSNEG